MNQLDIIKESIQLMDDRIASGRFPLSQIDPWLTPEHIHDMLKDIEVGFVPTDTIKTFDEGKLGRWTGWIQCSIVALGLATSMEMYEISRKILKG